MEGWRLPTYKMASLLLTLDIILLTGIPGMLKGPGCIFNGPGGAISPPTFMLGSMFYKIVINKLKPLLIMLDKLKKGYRDVVSKIKEPPQESQFLEKGILTPDEFVQACDKLK